MPVLRAVGETGLGWWMCLLLVGVLCAWIHGHQPSKQGGGALMLPHACERTHTDALGALSWLAAWMACSRHLARTMHVTS